MPHFPTPFWGGDRLPTRERTLLMKCEGTIVNSEANQLGDPMVPGSGYARERKGTLEIFSIGQTPLSPAILRATSAVGRGLGYKLDVSTGFGTSNSYDYRTAASTPTNGSRNNDSTYVATHQITNVRTKFRIAFKDTGVAGANGDPTYGGVASNDVNPPGLVIEMYEEAQVGAVVTTSLALTGPYCSGSVSSNVTLLAPFEVYTYATQVGMYVSIFENLSSLSATMDATLMESWSNSGPASTVSDSDGTMSCSVTGPAASVTVVGDYAGTLNTDFRGAVKFATEPHRTMEIHGMLYALAQEYPDSLTLGFIGSPVGQPQYVVLNPSGTETVTQRSYSITSVHNDNSEQLIGSADEWDGFLTYLTNASLAAAGEDTRDWVTMIADRSYPALRLSHAEETLLPDPTESGGTWSYDWSGSPGNWEGYSYLRIWLKTDVIGETVTIACDSDPGKTFSVVTTSTALTPYTIDLCKPDSPEPDDNPELWDSRLPLRNDGLPHRDPSAWGIARIRGYDISGGTNLVIDQVSLVRITDPIHSPMVAWNDWELVQTDESYHADGSVGSVPIIQTNRCIVIDVDGRRSIIEPCSARQLETDESGNPLWVYSFRNARNFKTTANACPGFTCDETPYSAGDGWFALDGSEGANWIDGGPIYLAGWSGFHEGGGVVWDGLTPQNRVGRVFDTEYNTIVYQPRYHEIIIFPGAGDVWGDCGGEYDVATPVRVAKILRAASDGIVYGDTGQTVYLKRSGATVSTGVTDTHQRYRQDQLPYGKGQHDHTVECGGVVGDFVGSWDPEQALGTTDATQERFNARRFHRAVFRTITRKKSWFYRVGPDRVHHRGYTQTGTIRLGRAQNATPGTFVDRDTGVTAEWVAGCVDRRGYGRRLFVCYGDGSSVNMATLDEDEGGLSVPIALGSGSYGEPLQGEDQSVWAYWVDAGTIKCQRYDNQLNLLESFSTNLTGVDDAPISLDEGVKGDNSRRIGIHYSVGGTRTMAFSDDGRTFT